MLIYHSFHSRLCGPHSDGEKSVGYLYFGRFFIFRLLQYRPNGL